MTASVFKSWQEMDWKSILHLTTSFEKNEWTVWRVQSGQRPDEQLRVMRMRFPNMIGEECLAVHFRIIARDGNGGETDGDIIPVGDEK